MEQILCLDSKLPAFCSSSKKQTSKMNVCLIFGGIAKLLCKCMVTKGVNLSKIWSKNYLYDHLNVNVNVSTFTCTKLVIHPSFDFPLPRLFNHHHRLLKVYNIFCCSWLFNSGKAITPFFRLASNAFPDILSRSVRLKKKTVKKKYHKKSWKRRPWRP